MRCFKCKLYRLYIRPYLCLIFRCRFRIPCCPKKCRYWVEDLAIDVLDFVINKGMRVLGPVLALAAVVLISLVTFCYFAYVFPYLQTQFAQNNNNNNSSEFYYYYGVTALMPYAITLYGVWLLTNIVFNHQSCVWTSAGLAPRKISQYPNGTQHIPHVFYKFDPELKVSHVIRFCTDCSAYKPWRSHHCSICRRCVLKMDHHCPWMWNCVGYNNYRYFFMFLFYLMNGTLFYICSGYHALQQTYRVRHCNYAWLPFFLCSISKKYTREAANGDVVVIEHSELFIFTYFLCVGISLVMVCFIGFHSYLVFCNQSTLESMTSCSAQMRGLRRFQSLRGYRFVYKLDLFMDNVRQVFGERWWLALCPIWTQPMGNGFVYPLRTEVRRLLFTANPSIDIKEVNPEYIFHRHANAFNNESVDDRDSTTAVLINQDTDAATNMTLP